jgi:4-hydroxy-2-oxoheptanedioate aldolase
MPGLAREDAPGNGGQGEEKLVEIRNPARERLERGELSLGFTVSLGRHVNIAALAKGAGFDWMFLEMEHGTLPLETAAQIGQMGLALGIAPIPRVPEGEISMATRMLDAGALGIVMPHVDTADEAREIVDRLKYPPLGHRSLGGFGPHFTTPVKTGEATAALNKATLVVVMLETPTAIENAAAIAAVPGVDVLMIGTNDLSAEMGVPGEFGHDRVAKAYQQMIAACRAHKKWPGMAGIYDEAIMARYIAMGAQFMLAGSDASFVTIGGTSRTKFLRSTPRNA